MARKVADCRKYPSETQCSLTIAGEEKEVLEEAIQHAVRVHGHTDTPELRSQLRTMLADETLVPSPTVPASRPEART